MRYILTTYVSRWKMPLIERTQDAGSGFTLSGYLDCIMGRNEMSRLFTLDI